MPTHHTNVARQLPNLSQERLPIIAATALLSLLAGCNSGSGNKAAPSTTPAPAAPAVVAQDDDAQPNAAHAPRQKGRPGLPRVEKSRPALDPSVNPLDVFVAVPGEEKWEMVEEDGKPVSGDDFTGALPPKGVDSTRFEPPDSMKLLVAKSKPQSLAQNEAKSPSRSSDTAAPKNGARRLPGHRTADRKTFDRTMGDGKTTDRKSGERRMAERRQAERKAQEAEAAQRADTGGGKTLPFGFSAVPSAKASPLGWPTRIRCDRDGAEMAFVPGGAVIVGHDGGPPESSPQLTVVLDSFYMDMNEVTLRQYEGFRKALKEERGRSIVGEPKNASSPPNIPVLGVTLTQAEFYARWAGKEIPSEAEWERAARGEAAFEHPWGNGRAIWKRARSRDEIDSVRSFRTDVSPFGIYDLAGNAREWCIDRYSPTAFADALKSSNGQLRNWKGPRIGNPENAHVVKGNGPNWEAWYRTGLDGSHPHSDVGFRCVLRLPERESADK